MQNQRVLITGGAGLIGSHIADLLVERNVREIVVLDNFVRGRRENLSRALAGGHITIVEGDIRDRKLLAEVMQGINLVFHQAAIRITQCAEEPRLAVEVLVDGTFNVAEQAVKSKVSKVVAASSASVYGMAEDFPTTERHHPYHNRTFYGAAKTFNEGILRSFHEMYGLNYEPHVVSCNLVLMDGEDFLKREEGRLHRITPPAVSTLCRIAHCRLPWLAGIVWTAACPAPAQ